MTTPQNASSGSTGQSSSGEIPDENQQTQNKNSVSYESHQKLLSEKKKVAEKAANLERELAELKQRDQDRENDELERQKNFEVLLRKREEELKEVRDRLSQIDTERVMAKKVDAFLKTLGGDLPEHYWSLIPIDEIAIDPATKSVDEMTVAKAVEDYRKRFPETIKSPAGKQKMPSDAPSGSPEGMMSYESWKAMKYNDPKKWEAVREKRVKMPS